MKDSVKIRFKFFKNNIVLIIKIKIFWSKLIYLISNSCLGLGGSKWNEFNNFDNLVIHGKSTVYLQVGVRFQYEFYSRAQYILFLDYFFRIMIKFIYIRVIMAWKLKTNYSYCDTEIPLLIIWYMIIKDLEHRRGFRYDY